MIELRLRSGQIVAFDGRVLEVFESEASDRVHVAQVDVETETAADGSARLVVGETAVVSFARDEAPACERLLAAIADTKRAYAS